MGSAKLVLDLSEVGAGDVALVGGKCASLGELFRALVPKGVRAVDGFATTSEAYRLHLAAFNSSGGAKGQAGGA